MPCLRGAIFCMQYTCHDGRACVGILGHDSTASTFRTAILGSAVVSSIRAIVYAYLLGVFQCVEMYVAYHLLQQ